MKMRRLFWLLLVFVSIFLFTSCGKGTAVDIEDLGPAKEGILLANIGGEPYYYDPVYLFKLTDGAFPVEPDSIDKKKALLFELAYLKMSEQGCTITDEWVEKDIKLRKMTAAGWNDSLAETEDSLEKRIKEGTVSEEDIASEKQELEELKVYVARYYELRAECIENAGLTEKEYWQEALPYIKKNFYVFKYSSTRMEKYIDQNEESVSGEYGDWPNEKYEEYYFGEFDELVEKYHVELIDADLL